MKKNKLISIGVVIFLIASSVLSVTGQDNSDAIEDNTDQNVPDDAVLPDNNGITEIFSNIGDLMQGDLTGDYLVTLGANSQLNENALAYSYNGESSEELTVNIETIFEGSEELLESYLADQEVLQSSGNPVSKSFKCSVPHSLQHGPYLEFDPMVEGKDIVASQGFKFWNTRYNTEISYDIIVPDQFSWIELTSSSSSGVLEKDDVGKANIEIDISSLPAGSHSGYVLINCVEEKIKAPDADERQETDNDISDTYSFSVKIPVKVTIWANPETGPSIRYKVLGSSYNNDIYYGAFYPGRHSVIIQVWNEGLEDEVKLKEFLTMIAPEDCSLYYLNGNLKGTAGTGVNEGSDILRIESAGDNFNSYDFHYIKLQVPSEGTNIGFGPTADQSCDYKDIWTYTPITLKTGVGTYEFNTCGGFSTDVCSIVVSGVFGDGSKFGPCLLPKMMFCNPYMDSPINIFKAGSDMYGGRLAAENIHSIFDPCDYHIDLGTVTKDKPATEFILSWNPSRSPALKNKPISWQLTPFTSYHYELGGDPLKLQWGLDYDRSLSEILQWNGEECPIKITANGLDDTWNARTQRIGGGLPWYGSPFGETLLERNGRVCWEISTRDDIDLAPGHYKVPINLLYVVNDWCGYDGFATFNLAFITAEFDVVETDDSPDLNEHRLKYNPIDWTVYNKEQSYSVFEMTLEGNSKSIEEESVCYTPISSCNGGVMRVRGPDKDPVHGGMERIIPLAPFFDIYPKIGNVNWCEMGTDEDSITDLGIVDTILGVYYPYDDIDPRGIMDGEELLDGKIPIQLSKAPSERIDLIVGDIPIDNNPIDPDIPTDPTDPEDPDEPVDPNDPADPDDPEEPEIPDEQDNDDDNGDKSRLFDLISKILDFLIQRFPFLSQLFQ